MSLHTHAWTRCRLLYLCMVGMHQTKTLYKQIYVSSGTTSSVLSQNYKSFLLFRILWSDHHDDKQYRDLINIKSNTQYFP